MSLSVLLIEDDKACSAAITRTLQRKGYEVTAAETCRSAITLMGLNNYGLVISDMRLVDGTGLHVITAMKKMGRKEPIVMMTGFPRQFNRDEAMSMGASAYLAKPFGADALLEAIRPLLPSGAQDAAPAPGEKPAADAGPATQGIGDGAAPPEIDTKFHNDYCQISIDDFISGQKIDLNLYVKLNDEKFLLIARAGEPLPPERLVAYREKKLEHLYVSRSDYEVYLSLQLRLLKAIESTKSLDADKRLRVLKHTNETILQRVYLPGVDPGAFTQAKAFTEATVALCSAHGDVSGLLDALNASSEHLYAHSVGVALYSLIVAKKMGWTSPGALMKLGLGAMLHDVGLKNAPPVLLTKPRRNFTREEQLAWERHTVDGMELLKGIDGMPVETLYVVSQHHEDRTGTGYPSGLREASIFPLARMVHAVDEFCDLVLKWPGVTPIAPLAAIDMLLNLKGAQLDPITLRALRAVFVKSEEKKAEKDAKAAAPAPATGQSALEGLAKKGAA